MLENWLVAARKYQILHDVWGLSLQCRVYDLLLLARTRSLTLGEYKMRKNVQDCPLLMVC